MSISKLLITNCLFFLFGCAVYAQKDKKADVVTMQVYVIDFIEHSNPNSMDYISKKYVVPVHNIDSLNIARLITNPALNKFNGYFVMTIDDIVSGITVMAKKYDNDYTKDSPKPFSLYQKHNYPGTEHALLNNKKYSSYSIAIMNGVWRKIVIDHFLPIHLQYKKKYLNAVPAADGKTFNYYLLEEILETKTM